MMRRSRNRRYLEPRVEYVQASSNGTWVWVLLCAFLFYKAYLAPGHIPVQPPVPPAPIQPDEKKQTVDLSQAWALVIQDPMNHDYIEVLDDDLFWEDWLSARVKSFERLDSTAETSKQFVEAANKAGVSVPFLLIAKEGENQTPILLEPLPKDSTDSLKQKIESLGQ